MQAHIRVLDKLDNEFNTLDQQYSRGELRVFGSDTEKIFKELDVIRHKQIEIAGDHIAIESIGDISHQSSRSKEADVQDDYQREVNNFNKKRIALNNLMKKLDDLRTSMTNFREISDLDG
ncbi:hypothetical protein PHYBLDRAFT_61881 [Phycomyces blakesleeanus NRRL 1555(-)]|uniref:Biogenesis of lysosome-related organelles complex 1 subunit CNL1 n=1 Tax=Phycomyces blakesleeanus (strain ATCC 8743b / DSM 1359 / FGSC 10004 / NBRC 33097 / NRRL 1555) TaxID=763407 RepID=A0A162YI13_PHYB8|nr:hypothetical protein PHYBLDRAFT_61881 [Phycomyces blakesleeanus NRRL 1555(-)]OAD80825.1 hypothetical protein PHYBLDRAFT_61881 [Phycomyces blakesleeanus NRRL 1555(-)]|eukprot:XP_018298865.1 hypothetical protein PHYBLDRAFT_61881 [Phycomyces blakesleeanus NRRL 1555(-)]